MLKFIEHSPFGSNPMIIGADQHGRPNKGNCYGNTRPKGHSGVDLIVCSKKFQNRGEGFRIHAVNSGKVYIANSSKTAGNWIAINHGVYNGYTMVSMYCHLKKLLVTKGTQVSIGAEIGLLGNTGHSYAPHLHFTIKAIKNWRFFRSKYNLSMKDTLDPIKCGLGIFLQVGQKKYLNEFSWFNEYPELIRGSRGFFVARLQLLLNIKPDGIFGQETESELLKKYKTRIVNADIWKKITNFL